MNTFIVQSRHTGEPFRLGIILYSIRAAGPIHVSIVARLFEC